MAWTQANIDTLKAAIATGKRKVQLNGRSVEYQSIPEMLTALDAMQRDFNAQSAAISGIRRPTGFRARTSKGL
mgnify:CR=1 FL=1